MLMPSSVSEQTLCSRSAAQEQEEEEKRDAANISNYTGSSSRDWLRLGLATAGPLSLSVLARRRASASDHELFGRRPSSPSSSSSSFSSSSSAVLTTSHRLISRRPWEISWSSAEMSREMPSPSTTTRTPRRSWAEAVGSSSRRNSSSSARAVSPPRRRSSQTGVWFTLRAAQNGGRESSLPHMIPRSYLRTSEGRLITVRWVIKYVVRKLCLEDESQVEITCRDHLLPPFWTLQYVRENIWCSGDAPAILPDSPTAIHHVMTLHYRRSVSSWNSHSSDDGQMSLT